MNWLITAGIALAALVIGAFAGYRYNKSMVESKIGRTEEYAKKLLDDTTRKADEKKKEMILEAKEEVLRQKSELDKEINARRADIQRSEHRAQQREEQLDKKMDALDQKEKQLQKRQDNVAQLEAEAESLKAKQVSELERIAAMTQDEARQNVIDRVQKEAYHDAAAMVRDIEAKAKEEGEKKARNIIALAIQRCAADHVAETTVSVINLPNDDMKGRIIGREGRNIRALETATGVDLIIDDTP